MIVAVGFATGTRGREMSDLVPIQEMARWGLSVETVSPFFGPWWGRPARRFYCGADHALKVAMRFSRLYRVRVQLVADVLTSADTIANLPHQIFEVPHE